MLYSSALVAISALVSCASAQSSSQGPTGRTLANPGAIPIAVRNGWCNAERNTCPQICGSGGYTENNCDQNALTYSCICRSGNTPNISDYAQTLPSAICQSDIDLCIAANPNDADAQANCRTISCGKKNATALEDSSSSTSSSSPSSTSGSSSSGTASSTASATTGATSASASPSTGAAALAMAREYGTPALLSGMLAVFGFLA